MMNCRVFLLLTVVGLCCDTESAFAQAKKLKFGGGGLPGIPNRAVEDPRGAPAPVFTAILEEKTKERKVFMPWLPDQGPRPGPYVATMHATRRIVNDEPAKIYLHIALPGGRGHVPEEDVRRIMRVRKEVAKKVEPLGDHVESAILTLSSRGLALYFNLKTGECQTEGLQVPDGFFDALSDVLADLEKLKAGKPAFQVNTNR